MKRLSFWVLLYQFISGWINFCVPKVPIQWPRSTRPSWFQSFLLKKTEFWKFGLMFLLDIKKKERSRAKCCVGGDMQIYSPTQTPTYTSLFSWPYFQCWVKISFQIFKIRYFPNPVSGVQLKNPDISGALYTIQYSFTQT